MYHLRFKDLVLVLCKLGKFIQALGFTCYLYKQSSLSPVQICVLGPKLKCLAASGHL